MAAAWGALAAAPPSPSLPRRMLDVTTAHSTAPTPVLARVRSNGCGCPPAAQASHNTLQPGRQEDSRCTDPQTVQAAASCHPPRDYPCTGCYSKQSWRAAARASSCSRGPRGAQPVRTHRMQRSGQQPSRQGALPRVVTQHVGAMPTHPSTPLLAPSPHPQHLAVQSTGSGTTSKELLCGL